MNRLLEGKVAIVTGAGRGIGRGIALLMAENGAKVVVNDVASGGEQPAEEVVQEIKKKGGEAVASQESVADPESAEKIIKKALDTFGRLDILVNNAGILRDRMVFNMTPEEWDAVLKVHLYGHFYCTKHAAAVFRQQRSGRIINVGSRSGLGNKGQANYAAAKEGIIGFTRTVARDMGGYGVTCNAIRPTAATRMTVSPEMMLARQRSGRADSLSQLEKLLPEDIAPFVVYLASDQAAHINGYDFYVAGGMVGIYSLPTITKSIHKQGRWTVEELCQIVPQTIAEGLINPAPPKKE